MAPKVVSRGCTTTFECPWSWAMVEGPMYAKEASATWPEMRSAVVTSMVSWKITCTEVFAGWRLMFHGSAAAAVAPQ